MSGPKSSSYTLTPEQRRILEEQRRLERRKAVANEHIKRHSRRLLALGGMFPSGKEISDELKRRGVGDAGFAEKMKELEGIVAPVVGMVASADDNVETLERIANEMSARAEKAEKLAEQLAGISAKNECTLHTVLREKIAKGFETSFADLETATKEDGMERKEELRELLAVLKHNRNLSPSLLAEVEAVLGKLDLIEHAEFLKNFAAVTVAPLVQRCNGYLEEYAAYHEAFEALYAEYRALCEVHCFVAQDYPCCAASVETLTAEIARMKEVSAEEDEQAYISECLDEVMEEMGYTVIGSREVTKKTGKRFHSELYTYGEGTAVNVTYASDGRITMEIGGMDTTDRLPDERETALLCDSMERFCDDFPEIERRLLAKGVVLKERFYMLPPTAEHAQIINTSDYQMSGEAGKLRAKRKRRAVAKPKKKKE